MSMRRVKDFEDRYGPVQHIDFISLAILHGPSLYFHTVKTVFVSRQAILGSL
jgi:hypothetical protein